MEMLSLILGIALLVAALVDLLWTTLWVTGRAGPITGWLASRAWRLTLRAGHGHHRLLSLFGPASLVAAMILWSTMLWLGWALVFGADPSSIRDAASGAAGDLVDRLYYTGYALFTMGNGDLEPAPAWRIPTVLTNASGIVLITLVVSYLISVLSAVVDARTFASRVAALGPSGAAIAQSGWDGNTMQRLDTALASLDEQLSRLAEQYAAYPILRYYHAAERARAVPPAVAALDDALILLEAVPSAQAPNRVTRRSLRGAIDGYMVSVGAQAQLPQGASPPEPSVAEFQQAGISIDQRLLAAELSGTGDRRGALAVVVHEAGWPWPAS